MIYVWLHSVWGTHQARLRSWVLGNPLAFRANLGKVNVHGWKDGTGSLSRGCTYFILFYLSFLSAELDMLSNFQISPILFLVLRDVIVGRNL